MKKPSLAFIVPRYSASIGGGAETLMRELAMSIHQKLVLDVEIITTCAKDNRTWNNYFEEGESVEDGLVIRRFPVDQRNLDTFIHLEHKMQNGYRLTVDEQISWIKNSVNSTPMYSFIESNQKKYDLLFYAPYLFGTTFWGSLITNKSILVPCLHDEAYAYLPIMRTMFRKAKGIMWNSIPEAQLAKDIYRIDDFEVRGFEVGMGFVETFVSSQNKIEPKSYFLYCGRKEKGKGLDVLLRYYEELKNSSQSVPPLILTGSGSIDFIEKLPDGVIDFGFVSEVEKLQLMKDAICLFQPSTNESFSIVMMEAWLQGTPVVVNSDCAVTKHHVEISQGGLHYRSYQAFARVVGELISDSHKTAHMGLCGKNHVLSYYSWDSVIKRFTLALDSWLE